MSLLKVAFVIFRIIMILLPVFPHQLLLQSECLRTGILKCSVTVEHFTFIIGI